MHRYCVQIVVRHGDLLSQSNRVGDRVAVCVFIGVALLLVRGVTALTHRADPALA